MDWHQWVGVFGSTLYLTAFLCLQLGVVRPRGGCYLVLNVFAASCVLLSLMHAYNLASVLIQVCWIFVSAFGLVRLLVPFLRPRET